MQGKTKEVKSLGEPLHVGMENIARRAMIPILIKRNLLKVSGDIMERDDRILFADPLTAVMKSMGMH